MGDADSDGDLDLVTGVSCPDGGCELRFYRSVDGQLQTPVVIPAGDVYAFSLAWGDVDNDGDLDLAAGVGGEAGALNRLYRNMGLPLASQPISIVVSDSYPRPVTAWGDVDGAGGQDLAIGQTGDQSALYANAAVPPFEKSPWEPQEQNKLTSLAWGDVDGDGDLDLAIGNEAPGPVVSI